jgi:ABC-type glutathione transport system ATPase component
MVPKNYREFCAIERSDKPLTRTVKTDDLTDMANECFDMPFDGVCKFYPFNVPQLPDYRILAIVGKSGSGKSTMLKSLSEKPSERQYYPDKYLPESYDQKTQDVEDAARMFIAEFRTLGLDPTRCWCKRYSDLSEGEKFRALLALQLDNGTVFDEFTSMVDRSVAETVSRGLRRLVLKEDLRNVVVCSCHKDFIPWLQPDVIVDLDDSKVYVQGIDSSSGHEENTTEEKIGEITV